MKGKSGTGKRIAFFLFSSVFLIYLKSIPPSIYWGDDGDLITASYFLGVAHPPGSPVFLVLLRIFFFIPFGDIAYRGNLFSALMLSLVIFFLYQVLNFFQSLYCRLNCVIKSSSAIISLFFALSEWTWWQTIRTEVYALNLLISILILSIFLKPEKNKRNSYLILFLMGLSAGVHYTTLIFLSPILFLIFISPLKKAQSKSINLRHLAIKLLFFLFGLSALIYLPARSSLNPIIDWGNSAKFKGFLWLISVKHYSGQVYDFNDQLSSFTKKSSLIFKNFNSLLPERIKIKHLLSFFLVIYGIFNAVKKERLKIMSLNSIILISLFFLLTSPSFSLENVDFMGYAVILFSVFSSFMALGLSKAVQSLNLIFKKNMALRFLQVFLFLIVFSILAIFNFFNNLVKCYKSDHWISRFFFYGFMDKIPSNSLFLTRSDAIFGIWYLKYVENRRGDLMEISRNGLYRRDYLEIIQHRYKNLYFPDQKESYQWFADFIRSNSEKFYIFWELGGDEGFIRDFIKIPAQTGLLILKDQNDLMKEDFASKTGLFFQRLKEEILARKWHLHDPNLKEMLGMAFYNLGTFYLGEADLNNALLFLEDAVWINPHFSSAWLNLGSVYAENGSLQKAKKCWEMVLALDPKNIKARMNLDQINLNRKD